MNDWMNGLGSYAPNRLLRRLVSTPELPDEPLVFDFEAAVLFADMQNFTLLAEELTRNDPTGGVKVLAEYLDIYIGQLVEIITNHGGDIIKFAGDACFAIWETERFQSLENSVMHATRCGLAIQKTLHRYEVAPDLRLALRVGLGAGKMHELHLGGRFDRWELLFVGDPMGQVGHAGKVAEPGQVIISPEARRLLKQGGHGQRSRSTYAVRADEFIPKDDRLNPPEVPEEAKSALRAYIPRAIVVSKESEYDIRAELLMVTVLFCKVRGISFGPDSSIAQVQIVMMAIQEYLYKYEGSINRFGVDEKGAILLAAFGLPPLLHDDDPARGIYAAIDARRALATVGYDASIGIATGRAFCGTVGNQTRCEYTMHGTNVNLAARLMMNTDTILVDQETHARTEEFFRFKKQPPLTVKGRRDPVNTYEVIAEVK